jgi:sugar-specific transcriptional regulator TrmB
MSTFLEKHPELLNLSQDEAKVYGLLNIQGEASAKDISYISGIPFSRIHKLLHRLQQEELVITRGETPKLFALRFKDPGLIKNYVRKAKTIDN